MHNWTSVLEYSSAQGEYILYAWCDGKVVYSTAIGDESVHDVKFIISVLEKALESHGNNRLSKGEWVRWMQFARAKEGYGNAG